ncbi:DUF6912 family protein [Ornithinimicrobium sp. Y1847]|uniref:DUF6912 family protein n=1 Tax=unclassified Ornithinimicrobium TaxID=2615080 RepID=UPI003B66DFE2
MSTLRCYLPLDLQQLEALQSQRRIEGPLPAFAVTGALRAERPSADQEEWEYAALQQAAEVQLRRGSPVVVAAADLAEGDTDVVAGEGEERGSGAVTVGAVDLPRVAALHVGDDVVTGDAGALGSVGADGAGGAGGDAAEVELSWYDTTELAHVIELVLGLTDRG